MKFLIVVISTLVFSISAIAKSKKSKAVSQGFLLQYGSNSWNGDSRKINTAFAVVRDKKTGKTAIVELEETEPDSSVFSGAFNLGWGKKKSKNEIFIPRSPRTNKEKYTGLVREGKVRRKPYLLTKNESGVKVLEVFDTKAQAKAALKAHRKKRAAERLEKAKVNPTDKKPIAAKALIAAAKLAELKAKQAAAAAEAARRETERVRLAQIEKQKEQERLRKQKALAAAEKARRKKKAAELARQAMAKYKEGSFQKASDLFEKSIDLDPTEKKYYFQYGVSLYRTQNFNKSIVILQNANDPSVSQLERQYFLGLNYYRLKEYDNALNIFRKVKPAKHEVLSPSAAFYEGLILYSTQKYEEAKEPFQFVLDTSKDPKLDEKAEEYIERILSILHFAKQAETKFFFSGSVNAIYDTNILLISDSNSTGTATDKAGTRMLGTGSAKWRPIFNKHHEFSVSTDVNYYYSLKEDFNQADTMQATLGLPYVYKGKAFGKSMQLEVEPGYEILYLDQDGDGSRDNILNSIVTSVTSTFVMSPKWFTAAILDFRQDDSKLTITDEADNADATQIGITNRNTMFLDKKKTKLLIGDVGFAMNNADGDNESYNKISLSAIYIQPWNVGSWEMSWTSNLAYYIQSYGDSSDDRSDNNITIGQSLSKPLNDWLNLSLAASYNKNSSSVDDNSYNKFTVTTSLSADYSL